MQAKGEVCIERRAPAARAGHSCHSFSTSCRPAWLPDDMPAAASYQLFPLSAERRPLMIKSYMEQVGWPQGRRASQWLKLELAMAWWFSSYLSCTCAANRHTYRLLSAGSLSQTVARCLSHVSPPQVERAVELGPGYQHATNCCRHNQASNK